MYNSHPSPPSPSPPPSLPPFLPPSLHLVTQRIHCPFQPKQSPSHLPLCIPYQTIDVPNKSLIKDPTIQLPGMDLPRGQWSLLNRFRTDAGPCRNSMHEWGYIASPLCECGEPQTMRHVVNECPLTCFDGGISELHLAQDTAFNWLLRQNLRS